MLPLRISNLYNTAVPRLAKVAPAQARPALGDSPAALEVPKTGKVEFERRAQVAGPARERSVAHARHAHRPNAPPHSRAARPGSKQVWPVPSHLGQGLAAQLLQELRFTFLLCTAGQSATSRVPGIQQSRPSKSDQYCIPRLRPVHTLADADCAECAARSFRLRHRMSSAP